jgi:hypothetical protein
MKKYKYEIRNWNQKKSKVYWTDDLQEIFKAKYDWAFNDRNMMSRSASFKFYDGDVELSNDYLKGKGLHI